MIIFKTKLKLHSCSSTHCADHNCDYCPNCSHSVYSGSATIDGRKYEWFHNTWYGPLFACKSIGKRDWLPGERHQVWKYFQRWHYRNFKTVKGGEE